MTNYTQPVWRRVVSPGTTEDGTLFVTIELHDQRNPQHGPELSITGVAGPRSNGDAHGDCGQVRRYLAAIDDRDIAQGWTREMIDQLGDIWDRWHLNGMRAGSPAQEQYLRDHPYDRQRHGSDHFRWARETLAEAGLQPDQHHTAQTSAGAVPAHGYSYGTAWLYESLPVSGTHWLRNLPTSPKAHPWGDSDYVRDES